MGLGTARELLRYNAWANGRVLATVAPLEPNQFTQPLGGSFPSLQATLTHMLWAEWLWLERWQGRSPKQVFAAAEFPSVSSLGDRWRQVQSAQKAFLESIAPEQLQVVVRYTNLRGEAWEYPLWRQLYHLFSHSSYHRGQVTTMLRLLGVKPETTDFLNFCDEEG